MAAPVVTHTAKVRALYKALLRLHRGMPLEMRALGDQYVRDEFKRHKNVGQQEANIFVGEWTGYYLTLGKQLSKRGREQNVGQNMSPELFDCFSEEQLAQLLELLKETKKPLADENS